MEPIVVILGAPEAMRSRLRKQLAEYFYQFAPPDAQGVIYLLCGDWKQHCQSLPENTARIALSSSPLKQEFTEAIAKGILHAAIDENCSDPELRAQCERTQILWFQQYQQQRQLVESHLQARIHRALLEAWTELEQATSLTQVLSIVCPLATEAAGASFSVIYLDGFPPISLFHFPNIPSEKKTSIEASGLALCRRVLERPASPLSDPTMETFAFAFGDETPGVLLIGSLGTTQKHLSIVGKTIATQLGMLLNHALEKQSKPQLASAEEAEVKAIARRQEEFVAIVSHELRTPLTSIRGALDISLGDYAGRLNDKQRQYITMALDSCNSLNRIVDDLLDVARAGSGDMAMQMEPLHLHSIANEAVKRIQDPAIRAQIQLQLHAADKPPLVKGDTDRLLQVLSILLSNAIKHRVANGKIRVRVFGPSVSSSHVGVSVYNDGPPLSEEALDRVFQLFAQVEKAATRRIGGAGLGLGIARAVIEAHKGRIWAEPLSQGVEFVFTLPTLQSKSAVLKRLPLAEEDLNTEVSGCRIVLVDAEPSSSYILKGILISSGYEVFVASDPDTALAEARKRLPHLIVIHASQELSDPHSLIEILKHDPDTRNSSILALLSEEQSPRDPLHASIDTLRLPITPDLLQRACGRLVKEAETTHLGRVLIVDDDPDILTICSEILRQAKMKVLAVNNGFAALEEAKRFRPDLLLLDIMMPNLDGFETAKRFKAQPIHAMVPIIFLSALGQTRDKLKAFQIGAEDYIVKPFSSEELVARIRKALTRSHAELNASPTTELPGGQSIAQEIESRLSSPDAAFCYLDLDNLKAYNDHYSYARADSIIRQTGDLIRDIVFSLGGTNDFIGHIAGDDFVFITTVQQVDKICVALCKAFDRLVPLYYDKEDRVAGYIEAVDRYDEVRQFPIMSVSISAITKEQQTLSTYTELARAAAIGKKHAKAIPGSCYLKNSKIIYQASKVKSL